MQDLPCVTNKSLNSSILKLNPFMFSRSVGGERVIRHFSLNSNYNFQNQRRFTSYPSSLRKSSLYLHSSNLTVPIRAYYRGYNPIHKDENEQAEEENKEGQGMFAGQRIPSKIVPHPFIKTIGRGAVVVVLLSMNAYYLPLEGTKMILLNLGLGAGLSYRLSLPLWLSALILLGVASFAFIPDMNSYQAYDFSFDDEMIRALNRDPRALEEFGSPIVRPPWSASRNQQYVVSKERQELTITKEFEILGGIGKGTTVCTASTHFEKMPKGPIYWNIKQLYWYPDVTRAKRFVKKKYRGDDAAAE